jgi:hypothetical protein
MAAFDKRATGFLFWTFIIGVGVFMYFAPTHHDKPQPVSDPAATYPTPPDSTNTYVPPPTSFGGHTCLGNCSGHQAGYDWAEDKGITDVEDCDAAGDSHNSPSFAEGCRLYVQGDKDNEDSTKDSDTVPDQDSPN